MQIRRLNPLDNPQELAAVLPAFQQWRRDYLPGFPDFGEARLRLWCTDGYRQHTAIFAAFTDEHAAEAEGLAIFGFEQDKNLDLAYVDINVPAGPRAWDIEKALFDEASRQTAELGRKRLAIGMPETMDPAAFAARQGDGRLTDTAISSALDLSTIDRAQYAAWAEPSAKNSEYSLVRWIDHCPDEYAESFCAALGAMADQPIGTFEYEFATYDLDRLRFYEEQSKEYGVRRYVQVALAPDGTVAGFNMHAAYPDEPAYIDIWDTAVVRAHRGHGLGLRVKAAASLWVLEERPDTRWVRTFNNDENKWMLAVNRKMGYRATFNFPGYEFTIS